MLQYKYTILKFNKKNSEIVKHPTAGHHNLKKLRLQKSQRSYGGGEGISKPWDCSLAPSNSHHFPFSDPSPDPPNSQLP